MSTKKFSIFGLATLFALTLGVSYFLLAKQTDQAQIALAATPVASSFNTNGWAWGDNIGWIAHNSADNPSVPAAYQSGINIDTTTGVVSGYAWNDGTGWINFNPGSGFPAAPNNGVRYDSATRQLSGWAQIVGYGANGWIKFRDTGAVPYGVSIAANGDFSGYAWSDNWGWFWFAPSGYPPVHYDATATPNVNGWVWNDGFGWIGLRYTDYDVTYGVSMDDAGNLKGYAWSEIGWIQYDPAGPYPSTPSGAPAYAAKWDQASGQVSGWIRATSMTSYSTGGWILMRGTTTGGSPYGVSINKTNGNWSGWAWNDVIGWINYDPSGGTVHTNFPAGGPQTPVLTSPLNCVDTYTSNPASPLTPTLNWSAYSALDGSTQSQYEIQVSTDSLFAAAPLIDDTQSSTSSSYNIALGTLNYNVAYYWRVRVKSSNNVWSAWGQTGTLGTETDCFRTPKHPAPLCNFTMNPNPPIINTNTQFTDTSTLYGGATVSQWSWTFGDGQTLVGSNPAVHKNPKHKYTSLTPLSITLAVTDSDSYACSKVLNTTVQAQLLPNFNRVIPR